MVTPSFCSAFRCAAVKGLSHMKVFMAGATKSGREKSQALNCTVKDGMSCAACGVHNLALTECPPPALRSGHRSFRASYLQRQHIGALPSRP